MAYRKEKLEELIHRIVSDVLLKETKDPRIGFVTVTGVKLSKDYSVARVGISILGNAREMRKSMEGLKSSIGFIQHRVGKELGMRQTPRIEFELDPTIAEGIRMAGVIDNLDGVRNDEETEDPEETPEE